MNRLALIAVALVACSSEESSGPRVIHFTPPDVALPTETFRHRESGLTFTTPGPGWRRLDLPSQLHDSAVVAFSDTTGDCRAWATMNPHARPPGELRPDPDLARAAADSARSETHLDEAAVHVDEYVLYDLWTARRWELQGRRDGEKTSIRATFFVDKGRLYRVQAEARGPLYGERRRCLDQMTAGFTFAKPSTPAPH
jgi:hypothetical protein